VSLEHLLLSWYPSQTQILDCCLHDPIVYLVSLAESLCKG